MSHLRLINGEKRERKPCVTCKNGCKANNYFGICGCDCHLVTIEMKPFTPESMARGFLRMAGLSHVRPVSKDDPILGKYVS